VKNGWLYIILVFICVGCDTQTTEETKNLIVRVGNEKLYLEDFQDNNLVDKWVKETLFKNQAEKEIDKATINPLVDNYRNSLLVHNYESMLIDKGLDTIIRDSEIDRYYELNRLDFILAEPAYLMYMILIPYTDKKSFVDKWKADSWEEIESICSQNKYWHHISDSLWVTKNELYEFLPSELAEEVKMRKGFYKSEKRDSMYYLIEVKNTLNPGKEAPKSIVRTQIEKLILHKRSRTLLEKEKSKLYEAAISKSSIIKYSDK